LKSYILLFPTVEKNVIIINYYQLQLGENDRVKGVGHGNQINGMKLDNDYLYTCGIDDSLRQVDIKSNSYTDLQIKLNAQPRGMDFNSNVIVTVTIKEVIQNILNEHNNSNSNINIYMLDNSIKK